MLKMTPMMPEEELMIKQEWELRELRAVELNFKYKRLVILHRSQDQGGGVQKTRSARRNRRFGMGCSRPSWGI